MRSATYGSLLIGIAAATSLLTACSGGGSQAVPVAGLTSSVARSSHDMQPLVGGPPPSPGVGGPNDGEKSPWLTHLTSHIPLNVAVLYVSGANCSCVLIYSQRGTDQAPIGMIGGMSDARGLFVDKKGTLYVGNSLADRVPIYRAGVLGKPIETLTDPGNHPSDVTRDGLTGTIYVVNQNTDGGGPGSISVYANGSLTPTYYLYTHPNTFIDSITLDAQHDLFAGYGDPSGMAQIDEFRLEKLSIPPLQLPTNLGYTGGMEIDSRHDLVVADPDFFNGHNAPAVDILSIGSSTPLFQFDEEGWPYYVALNKDENHIYVSDARLSQVREYTYPGGVLLDTITKGMEDGNYPVGVAVAHPGPL